MSSLFEPFTPEEFNRQTGLVAADNEAIYLRWVNTQINYANYQTMREMVASLKEIKGILKENPATTKAKAPL
jgi:hypothetical protein